jgi:hypothetical protein
VTGLDDLNFIIRIACPLKKFGDGWTSDLNCHYFIMVLLRITEQFGTAKVRKDRSAILFFIHLSKTLTNYGPGRKNHDGKPAQEYRKIAGTMDRHCGCEKLCQTR